MVSMALVSDTGSSSSDKITSNPAVKGVGQANTLVTIKEGGVTLGTAMADGTGAWSFTPAGLADGAHTLTASQTDLAGNTGTATLSFTLDSSQERRRRCALDRAGFGHRQLVDRQDYLQPGGQGRRSGQHAGHHQGGRRHARHGDGGRHGRLELHADRSGRRRSHTHRQPDRSRRQHRDGDAELHARQSGAGGEHGAGFGHRQLIDRQDYLQPGGQGRRSGQHAGHHQGRRRHARHRDGGRHGRLELHAGRSGRRRAHVKRQPDRSRRQHRDGNAELHARQFAAPSRSSMALVSDTGSSASDKITSNPAVKGVGQANTLVTIKEGGVTLGTAMADGTGAWSFTPAGLADGAHILDRQPDRSRRQHRNGDAELHARRRRAPRGEPLPWFRTPAARRPTRSPPTRRSRDRSGQYARHHQGGRRTLGTAMADGTGAWSFTPAGLVDGAHTLTASQTDLAGNTGTATLSFTLDSSPGLRRPRRC